MDVDSTDSDIIDLIMEDSISPVKEAASSTSNPLRSPSDSTRLPLRVGITWKRGERLEAMDYSRTWYPSKIVEIDEEAKQVLIHFEGWNSRYDEWLAMASEKLRPATRHSERKDKTVKRKRVHPLPQPPQMYKLGESVFAKWTDCKKYPAKITRIFSDGSYEVQFCDGIVRNVQPINIQPLPADYQQLQIKKPTVTSGFKSVKVQLPESVEKRLASGAEKKSKSKKSEKDKKPLNREAPLISPSQKGGLKVKVNLQRNQVLDNKARSKGPNTSPVKLSSVSSYEDILDGNDPPDTSHPALPPSASEAGSQTDLLSRRDELKRKKRKRFYTDGLDLKRSKRQKFKSRKYRDFSADVTNKLPTEEQVPMPLNIETTMSISQSSISTPKSAPILPIYLPYVPAKAFVVEEDHNPYKCQHDGCTKEFRKQGLLDSHIKYYHTSLLSPAGLTGVSSPTSSSMSHPLGSGKKRRRKTDSICSTDSDISVSSRGKTPRRQRHSSELSVATASPDLLLSRDHNSDWKVKSESVCVDDGAETEEDENLHIINCVCGSREDTGLMIQCDLCLCWQHFPCVDVNNTGEPPETYVCTICEKPPGLRSGSRFAYDLSWEKNGELPCLPFSRSKPGGNLQEVAQQCNSWLSTLVGIKRALHSTRRQIKISKEENDPEFQLWQTDWDTWTKPEEFFTFSIDNTALNSPSTPLSHKDISSIATSPLPSTSKPMSIQTVNPSTDKASDNLSPTQSGKLGVEPPPTPVSSRKTNISTTSNLDGLVCDLFPGPCGDAPVAESAENTDITLKTGFQGSTLNSKLTDKHEVKKDQIKNIDLQPESKDEDKKTKDQINIDLSNVSNTDLTKSVSEVNKDSEKDLLETVSFVSKEKKNLYTVLSVHEKIPNKEAANDLSSKTSQAKEPKSELYSNSQTKTPSTESGKNERTEDIKEEDRSFKYSQSEKKPEGLKEFLDVNITEGETIQGVISEVEIGDTVQKTNTNQEDFDVGDENVNLEATLHVDGMDTSNLTSLDVKGIDASQSMSLDNKGMDVDLAETSQGTNVSLDVSASKSFVESQDDEEDNETDTAEESADPYKNCEYNLLVHIQNIQADLETQLQQLEQHISDMENSERNDPAVQLTEDNVLNDVPALKKSLLKLGRSVGKITKLTSYN